MTGELARRFHAGGLPIPKTKSRPWYVREAWPSIGAGLVAVVSGVGALLKERASEHSSGVQLAFIGTGVLAGAFLGAIKTAQALYKDAREDHKESPGELRGCLHVIHGAVVGLKKVATPPAGWLRVALHRVDGDNLEQIVDYVGSDDGGAGRVFTIHAGVIGRVAREKQARTFDRTQDMPFDEWVRYLVNDLGMTEEKARVTRSDRYAFLGVPIKGAGSKDVRAVVYLDAGEPGFFDPETIDVVVDCCAGLASWIDEYYYSRR